MIRSEAAIVPFEFLEALWFSPALIPERIPILMRAYWGWGEWSPGRQLAVGQRLAMLTVQRLIADLPCVSQEVAHTCREATTLAAAEAAAEAALVEVREVVRLGRTEREARGGRFDLTATEEAMWEMAYAARGAARTAAIDAAGAAEASARTVLWAAALASREKRYATLVRAMDLWIEAAKEGI